MPTVACGRPANALTKTIDVFTARHSLLSAKADICSLKTRISNPGMPGQRARPTRPANAPGQRARPTRPAKRFR